MGGVRSPRTGVRGPSWRTECSPIDVSSRELTGGGPPGVPGPCTANSLSFNGVGGVVGGGTPRLMDPLLLLRPDSELLDPLDDDSDDAMWDVPTRTLGPEMTIGMYTWTFIHTTKRRADHTYIIFRLIFSKMCLFRVTPVRQVRFICRICLDHLTELSYVLITSN